MPDRAEKEYGPGATSDLPVPLRHTVFTCTGTSSIPAWLDTFNRIVLHDSGTWNEDLKDFDNGHDANGEVINAGVYILQALAADPDGIAFANLLYANPNVKQIGLAEHAGSPFVLATSETIWDHTYPLHRFSTLYINRKPGTPVDPKVKEFIRYILSREGMQAVVDDGAYTPINEHVAQAQRHKLD